MIQFVWDSQGITDENIKNATLVNALQDRALMWYIKYSTNHPNEGIAEIQDALNKYFGRPKLETRSVIGFKEIVILLGKTSWDLDQSLKRTIREANMTLTNAQHCTWFVPSLTPPLRTTLSQQKISTQAKALETTMRLYETPILDLRLGVQQIHVQLQNLSLKMQSLKQERVS